MDTALGFSTAVGFCLYWRTAFDSVVFSEKFRGTALCGRHERTGRVKLNFFGSLSPSLPSRLPPSPLIASKSYSYA